MPPTNTDTPLVCGQCPQTPEELAAFVATIPEWDPNLDDDPHWVRPTSQYGFEQVDATETDALDVIYATRSAASAAVAARTPVHIDPSRARFTAQPYVRLDVLDHYVTDRSRVWDPDGWFGNEHPVVTPWRDGYLVLDGTNRIAADRIAGRGVMLAYVVANSRYTLT